MRKFTKYVAAMIAALSMLSVMTGCGSVNADQSVDAVPETTAVPEQTTLPTQPETTAPAVTTDPNSMEDALFIGDSRTMGLLEYSGLECDFFASVGMSVYNIQKSTVSVPSVGKVTLKELLSNKKYGKIYLMIGINELGYDLGQTASEYEKLVNFIREQQPDAKLFLQANLHVTKKKSDSHDYIKNTNINTLNEKIAKFADGKNIFYLDVNPVYDDANHALSEDYTSDGVHLYAKHYAEWAEWIAEQTASQLKEG